MAGPWEDYAPKAQAAPWEDYAPKTGRKPDALDAIDPTEGMTGTDKFLSGVGKAMTDTGRGVGQMLGLVNRDDVAESRRLDAPLMNTGAGVAGNIAGNMAVIAPTAFIPGANTLAGAGLVGAVTGAVQPSVSTGETAMNIAAGGAGGAGGQWLANKVPGAVQQFAQSQRDKAAQAAAQASQKFTAAQKGAGMGYVVPPADLNPGVVSELLSGVSGKIKTAQTASARNQSITDSLAKKALGIPDNVPLNIETLNAIRSNAGQAYEAVSGAGTVAATPTYAKALDDAVKPFTSQLASFPNRKVPAVVDDILSLKTGQFDAGDAIQTIKVLRAEADKAYGASDKLAGKAYKDAAAALEDAIDGHLVQSGAPADMLKAYRDARQTIAKTYTVQKALNDTTGNVSAQSLAADLKRQKPLSGELRSIAEFSQAFPKATQALQESPKQWSPLDMFAASATSFGTQNPLPMLAIGARPAVRSAILSGPVQRAAMNPGFAPSRTSQMLPGILANDAFRISAPGAGVAGGLLGADWFQ